jgi:hypothetical protein
MIRWHHVAHGIVRGKEFDIEIASVEAGFIARALVEGAPPLEDTGVSPSEHAAVGAAAGRAYAFAHASTRGMKEAPLSATGNSLKNLPIVAE